MKHSRRQPTQLPYIAYAVASSIVTIILCYTIKPHLLSPRIAFSELGAFPPTSYIFTSGQVLAAFFILLGTIKTKSLFQRFSQVIAAMGFLMVGVFRIEHGELLGNLHRIGGFIMMLAIITSLIGKVISQWGILTTKWRILYVFFSLLGVTSIVMSVLSSSQFRVLALQGLAQYIGLMSLVGWALLDRVQKHEN